MLVDEDPLVQKIEHILKGSREARACVEWGGSLFGVTVIRMGLRDHLTYRVLIFDGENSTTHLRGVSASATWIECPSAYFERGWWRLSPCGVDFLREILDSDCQWMIVE